MVWLKIMVSPTYHINIVVQTVITFEWKEIWKFCLQIQILKVWIWGAYALKWWQSYILSDWYMCSETLIYGAKYFFWLAPPTITKLFLKDPLEWKILKMYIFTHPTLFTFKLEPIELKNVAKKPNLEF